MMTITKYIDREALIEWLKRIPLKDLSDGLVRCRVIMEDDFKKAIKNMPKGIIVDAVPVVRCKDCAVPHNRYTGCPKLNGLVTPPDFYCPFGERKEDVSE